MGLNFNTIAMQNERSGFITLLGYIGLVYAFIGDLLIFHETIGLLQVLGILVIVFFNVTLVVQKTCYGPEVAAPVASK